MFLGGGFSTSERFTRFFALGMITGAAFAHNFMLAGKSDSIDAGTVGGIGWYGQMAVVLGLVVCFIIGFAMRKKSA